MIRQTIAVAGSAVLFAVLGVGVAVGHKAQKGDAAKGKELDRATRDDAISLKPGEHRQSRDYAGTTIKITPLGYRIKMRATGNKGKIRLFTRQCDDEICASVSLDGQANRQCCGLDDIQRN